MIQGKYKIIECDFKIPGWHTDLKNSIYHFFENDLIIDPNNIYSKTIIKTSFHFDGMELSINSTKFKYFKVSESKFKLENEIVILEFVEME